MFHICPIEIMAVLGMVPAVPYIVHKAKLLYSRKRLVRDGNP